MQTIKIDINLNAPQEELQRAIQRNIYLVAGGLLSSSQIKESRLKLTDTSIEMNFDPSLVWSASEVQDQLREWILQNGFRDSVECLNTFLESTHAVCSVWSLQVKQNRGQTFTGADWDKEMRNDAKKFHRLGFPDKLDHLREKHGIHLNSGMSKHVLSINSARNCLVHRKGIVGETDIENGCLLVSWRRAKLVITNEDGEHDLAFGEVQEKDSMLGLRFVDEERFFNLGDQILFSAEEFQHIAWSVFLFGRSTIAKVSEWGEANGFISPTPANA